MEARGFCNYAHTDRFEMINKEGTKRKDGAEAWMSGQRREGATSGGGRHGRRRATAVRRRQLEDGF